MGTPGSLQSIQKLLDENAQLIRALVENMTVKGKPLECIQYQQNLHKNLVYLASLADPSLDVQRVLPPPGSIHRQQQQQQAHGNSQATQPSTTTTASSQPSSVAAAATSQSAPAGGGGGGTGGGVSSTAAMTQRQSQAVSTTSGSGPAPSEAAQGMRHTPPLGQQYSQKPSYSASMWGGPNPGDPYGMQRPPGMGGSGFGMGPEAAHLRMRQEQLIQAQQARRIQQHQQQQAAAAAAAAAAGGGGTAGGMYPMGPPPAPGQAGMMPPSQPGMPPTFPPNSMNPLSGMPPGNRPRQ